MNFELEYKKYTAPGVYEKLQGIKTIPEFMLKITNDYHDLVMLKQDEVEVKYSELMYDVLDQANTLKVNDVKRRTNVGLYCNNDYNFIKSSLGIMAYGSVATLLPPQLDDKSVYGCCLKYQLTALVYEEQMEEKVAFAKQMLPNVKFIKIESHKLDNLSSDELFDHNLLGSDPACIVFTGGTTGKSKGALLSHLAIMTGTFNGTLGTGDPFHQVYYSIMPLTHVFGFIRNMLTSLLTGSMISFCTNKMAMFKQIQALKPTILVIVPALAELFMNLSKQYTINFLGGRLQTIICGAATVPPYIVKEFHSMGVNLCPGYGLTELANLVSGNPIGNEKPSSVGLLYPNQEIKVVDDELWIKGDNLMIEYFNEPEENKIAFEDGWFKTGDLVRFDEDGYMYITGRIKDIIVLSNGENVSPAYIEAKICEINCIQDALVTQTTNDIGHDILQVEVVLRQSVIASLNIENMQEYIEKEVEKVNSTLDSYERITKVVIRDTDFERSPSMKIIRPKANK